MVGGQRSNFRLGPWLPGPRWCRDSGVPVGGPSAPGVDVTDQTVGLRDRSPSIGPRTSLVVEGTVLRVEEKGRDGVRSRPWNPFSISENERLGVKRKTFYPTLLFGYMWNITSLYIDTMSDLSCTVYLSVDYLECETLTCGNQG